MEAEAHPATTKLLRRRGLLRLFFTIEQIGKAACDWQTGVGSFTLGCGRRKSFVHGGNEEPLGGSLSSIMTAVGAPDLCHQGITTRQQHTQPFMSLVVYIVSICNVLCYVSLHVLLNSALFASVFTICTTIRIINVLKDCVKLIIQPNIQHHGHSTKNQRMLPLVKRHVHENSNK